MSEKSPVPQTNSSKSPPPSDIELHKRGLQECTQHNSLSDTSHCWLQVRTEKTGQFFHNRPLISYSFVFSLLSLLGKKKGNWTCPDFIANCHAKKGLASTQCWHVWPPCLTRARDNGSSFWWLIGPVTLRAGCSRSHDEGAPGINFHRTLEKSHQQGHAALSWKSIPS